MARGGGVCPEPRPGPSPEQGHLAEAHAPSPTRPDAPLAPSGSAVHPHPRQALFKRQRESAVGKMHLGARRSYQRSFATQSILTGASPCSGEHAPRRGRVSTRNDSLSPQRPQESTALLDVFPNYRDSRHKHQTFPLHVTSVRNVSCKSVAPNARRVPGYRRGWGRGSRPVCTRSHPSSALHSRVQTRRIWLSDFCFFR